MMKANPSPMSVADYCESMDAKKITVNHDYQREEGIWGAFARSYFIESIILGYPVPKFFLYTRFDLYSRKSIKEIVDGQQRSHALFMFYKNRMVLSKKISNPDLDGKRYRDLSDEQKQNFLSYSLSIDEFSGVPEEEIRESFSRMNTNNVSLNAEELLNAKYQGEFKQFILSISRIYRELLISAGVISRRDVIRMQDNRMFADVISILEDGFITTKASNIERLYRSYNITFGKEDSYGPLIQGAIKDWQEMDGGNYDRLARRHIFYTHIAAHIANRDSSWILPSLSDEQKTRLGEIRGFGLTLDALNASLLANAVPEELVPFHAACSQKTNVDSQKFERFAYLLSAIEAG
jgi:hypothetical protein